MLSQRWSIAFSARRTRIAITVLREIAGPAGRLEALLDQPAERRTVSEDGLVHAGIAGGLRAAVVFGHPHPQFGGTMHTKTVYQSAKALTRIGCAVLRFNFRGAGRSAGVFDDGPGEMEDFRTALDFMRGRYPDAPLWAAGMSFGSWIALSVGAEDPRVSLLLGIAVPVSKYDFGAVATSTKPKCFIHGERDEICPLKDMREFYARAVEPKELAVIDAADHLFDGKVSEVADAVEDLLGDWSL
jgi:alpha/beta superfamily hydrolase